MVRASAVSADQMTEVDRVMVDDLRIDLTQMMANAGRALVELAIHRFRPRRVVGLAGHGGTGSRSPC